MLLICLGIVKYDQSKVENYSGKKLDLQGEWF